MKKRFFLSLKVSILLCFIFTSSVFASNTILSLDVYEIAVKSNEPGYFLVNGEKYVGNKSFFRKKGDSILITAVPESNFAELINISCKTDGVVIIGEDSVTINEIQNNAEIEFEFKRTIFSGGPSENEGVGKDEKCDGGEKCPIKHFVDVDTKDWYHENLDYVVTQKLMNGISTEKFAPHEPTNRAMVVTILYRLENEPKVKTNNLFDDVEQDTWYTNAIMWANSNNIVLGYGDGRFGPKDNVTREQMVTILHRYAQYKKYKLDEKNESNILAFDDVKNVSDWSYEAVKWACGEEIIKGSDGKIMPKASTQRCQMAAILHRFCENMYVK